MSSRPGLAPSLPNDRPPTPPRAPAPPPLGLWIGLGLALWGLVAAALWAVWG